jgi:hypothetical protein
MGRWSDAMVKVLIGEKNLLMLQLCMLAVVERLMVDEILVS